jgi:hypothetical protein
MRPGADTVFVTDHDGRIRPVSTESFANLAARFKVNEPDVVAESIDNEVIIINLNSGAYYSSLGTGGAIWQALVANHTLDETLDLLAAHYDRPRQEIEAGVTQFVAQLLDEALLLESAEPATGNGLELGQPAVFETPVLSKYTDMQELLLLDPIHDVDPSIGWPFPRAAD